MKRALILAAWIFQSAMLTAQTNYSDYKKSTPILEESFESRTTGWTFEDFSVSDGWLMHTKRNGLALMPVEIDQKQDFEMEALAQVNPGYSPDIIFGDYFALFTLAYENGFQKPPTSCLFVYRDPRPGFRHMPDPKYHVTDLKKIPTTDYFLVTFRKVGSFLYLFVNKELVAQTPFHSFVDSKVGIWGQINCDYLNVSYLERAPLHVVAVEPAREMVIKDSEGGGVKPGGKYFGLIVGVSQYADSQLNLDKPAKDAQKLKDILIGNYSFEESTTTLLLNPTRQKLMAELFRLRKVIGPNDNLLIFYAGHGYWDEDAKQGYWWAADANSSDPSFWLSNSDVREQIRSIKSGHTILISDACFSGGLFKTRSAVMKDASLDFQMLYRMPSRRAITSGTMTTVPDQSVFFEYLSKRLLENTSKFMSSQQLFDSFRTAIINNSMTVPQDGVIAETGDEGGDFIFIRKN